MNRENGRTSEQASGRGGRGGESGAFQLVGWLVVLVHLFENMLWCVRDKTRALFAFRGLHVNTAQFRPNTLEHDLFRGV